VKYTGSFLIAALSLLFASSPVSSQNIYKWIDAQGHVHFSNTPIGAADSVDDELPPSTNFGDNSASPDSPTQASPSTEPQNAPPQPTTTAAVPQQDEEEDTEPSTPEESTTTGDNSPTASEDAPAETLPQTVAELSEQVEDDGAVTPPPQKGDDEDSDDSSDEDLDEDDTDDEEDEDSTEEEGESS
jgi:hypothetical protein